MTEAVLENPDLFDLTMSEEAQPLLDAVKKHIKENVDPIAESIALAKAVKSIGVTARASSSCRNRQAKAKDSGLWNFFRQMLKPEKASATWTTPLSQTNSAKPTHLRR